MDIIKATFTGGWTHLHDDGLQEFFQAVGKNFSKTYEFIILMPD